MVEEVADEVALVAVADVVMVEPVAAVRSDVAELEVAMVLERVDSPLHFQQALFHSPFFCDGDDVFSLCHQQRQRHYSRPRFLWKHCQMQVAGEVAQAAADAVAEPAADAVAEVERLAAYAVPGYDVPVALEDAQTDLPAMLLPMSETQPLKAPRVARVEGAVEHVAVVVAV